MEDGMSCLLFWSINLQGRVYCFMMFSNDTLQRCIDWGSWHSPERRGDVPCKVVLVVV